MGDEVCTCCIVGNYRHRMFELGVEFGFVVEVEVEVGLPHSFGSWF